ncbi:MAG: hypothetical protein AVDCRST_MAG96-1674 [uncultured Segetibacter sp.]|uniref:Uncharacterized protein n=1 Tax=uncultured Segetibacter sp. TaxID=481133 RepID=A0A6J4SB30_9BACT|nr:MAG: hypothetical protein AVDCRST_MAG96-1674 [uncultured Segetibacter sp.]
MAYSVRSLQPPVIYLPRISLAFSFTRRPTPESFLSIVENEKAELGSAPYIQKREEVFQNNLFQGSNHLISLILEKPAVSFMSM